MSKSNSTQKEPMYIPTPKFSYFCKSGEVRPVMNRWAEREYKISESCYKPIEDQFPSLEAEKG